MAKTTRLVKTLIKLILPVVLLVILAVAGASVWLTYKMAHPLTARYLVTPDKYGLLSSRGAQVTNETWPNRDGSISRGWLLRGAANAPAVILFHRYGTDRSYQLDLGVKLNESTNFTVLMPDLRGHGEDPPVKNTSFGGCEGEDSVAAVEFVRGLRDANQIALVGQDIGVYGLELGAIAALNAAAKEKSIKAIVLDSVPRDSDQLLRLSVAQRLPFASTVTSRFAVIGSYLYYYDGCYKRDSTCAIAEKIEGRNVLLLAGVDQPQYGEATSELARCFSSGNSVETKLDLSPSGLSIRNASIEQSEAYGQRLIDFFRKTLTK